MPIKRKVTRRVQKLKVTRRAVTRRKVKKSKITRRIKRPAITRRKITRRIIKK